MRFILRLARFPFRLISVIFYKIFFGSFGWRSNIRKPLRIDGRKNIYIGNKVIVEYKSWLASMPLTGGVKAAL